MSTNKAKKRTNRYNIEKPKSCLQCLTKPYLKTRHAKTKKSAPIISVIGWSAISGNVALEPLILFAVIFIWTPPHFWALALYRSDDYEAAGVPMLPNTHGPKETRKQILAYSIILFAISLMPCFIGMAALPYVTIKPVKTTSDITRGFNKAEKSRK